MNYKAMICWAPELGSGHRGGRPDARLFSRGATAGWLRPLIPENDRSAASVSKLLFLGSGSAPQSDLVAIRIAIECFANAVAIGKPIFRFNAATGYFCHPVIKIIYEYGQNGMTRMVAIFIDRDTPMFGQFPYHFGIGGNEAGRAAEQPCIPFFRNLDVPNVDACIHVDWHDQCSLVLHGAR